MLDAAENLLAKRGYQDMTVNDIARRLASPVVRSTSISHRNRLLSPHWSHVSWSPPAWLCHTDATTSRRHRPSSRSPQSR
jgi:hypothetical protein